MQSLVREQGAGDKLMSTGNAMVDDPRVTALEQQKLKDEGAAPNPGDYKPGFGTRLLRGLKGFGLGAAEGGIFGAAAGAIDPALVKGGTAYGAPTDAYDVALAKNKQQVASDASQLETASADFKRAQDLRTAQEKAFEEGGQAFGRTVTGATGQQDANTKVAQLPIDKEKADAELQKAKNEDPATKLNLTQEQVNARTRFADAQRIPQGALRTRYILTGEIQPGREATADEIAVNRIAQTFTKEHGTPPKTVADWQGIYAAAKGGTAANNPAAQDKNLGRAASLAERYVKELSDQKKSPTYILMTAPEKAAFDDKLDQATQEYQTYQRELVEASAPGAGAGTPAAAPAAAPPPSPGQPNNAQATIRMYVPQPGGGRRIARFTPAGAAQAKELGAVEVDQAK
jgi:hypothetical protein